MKVEKAIKNRRSVRHYLDRIPAERYISKIIEAGIWAPSGLNNQPWKFKVIRSPEVKQGLARFTKYGNTLNEAPVVILVFLDNTATYNREKDIMSVGASIQNMMLAAFELGLGTCWLGEIVNRKKEVEKYLKTDPDHELMAAVTVGFSDEGISKGSRKKVKSFMLE